MARSRRTRFAASFVAVVAAGCSHEATQGTGPGTGSGTGTGTGSAAPKPTNTWYVTKNSDGTCTASVHVDCPPPSVATCNPPAPMYSVCPDGVTADQGAQIVSYDGAKTCVVDGAGHPQAPVDCPTYDAPKPPPSPPDAAVAAFQPRRWDITSAGGHDCYAELLTFSCPEGATCNPPAPRKVKCPPYNAGNEVTEIAAGKCQMLLVEGGGHCPPHAHCNPPPPREVDVPCP